MFGFSLREPEVFENGWALSVQDGFTHYCTPGETSEIAVLSPGKDDGLIPLDLARYAGMFDQVIKHVDNDKLELAREFVRGILSSDWDSEVAAGYAALYNQLSE
jgi:hypothetical protein